MEFRELNFNLDLIEDLTEKSQWLDIISHLKQCFHLEKDEYGNIRKLAFSKQVADKLHELLEISLTRQDNKSELILMAEESMKSLRNYATNTKIQEYICEEKFFQTLNKYIDLFIENPMLYLQCMKYTLQLNINMFTNETLRLKIHTMIFVKLCRCFFTDTTPIYETSALMYNLLKLYPLTDDKIIERTIELYTNNDSIEYLEFIMDKIISEEHFWENYGSYNITTRITLITYLREVNIREDIEINNKGLNRTIMEFLNSTNIIFNISHYVSDTNYVLEVSKIAELISSLSSKFGHLTYFQANKDILITAGVLLINIHRQGNQYENCFTTINKLSDVLDPKEDITQNPTYGFKANLIRLVGNLCWKNKEMQDLARTAELIPIVLDSCNIDARNPFIMQWAIVAIRNICDGNMENQKYIANLNHVGPVPSEVLDEFGLTFHTENGHSLKVIQLDSMKKS